MDPPALRTKQLAALEPRPRRILLAKLFRPRCRIRGLPVLRAEAAAMTPGFLILGPWLRIPPGTPAFSRRSSRKRSEDGRCVYGSGLPADSLAAECNRGARTRLQPRINGANRGYAARSERPRPTSPEALRAFQALITDWRLAPARAWRMLTGVGYQAGSLSPEQVARVEMLVELDRIMRPVAPGSVGEWMVEPNRAALLEGSAPVDYLTKRGGRGYAALLRQAQQWAAR